MEEEKSDAQVILLEGSGVLIAMSHDDFDCIVISWEENTSYETGSFIWSRKA